MNKMDEGEFINKLQDLNNILSSKESYYLIFHANKTEFDIKFDKPIKLNWQFIISVHRTLKLILQKRIII